MTASIKSSSALVTVHNKIVSKRYFIIFLREKKGENITETYQGINNVSGRSIILNFVNMYVTGKSKLFTYAGFEPSDLTSSTVPNEEIRMYVLIYIRIIIETQNGNKAIDLSN